MRQDLHRRHVAQRMEINREQAPAQEGEGGGQDTGAHGEKERAIAEVTLSLMRNFSAGASGFKRVYYQYEIFLQFSCCYFMVRCTKNRTMVQT
jgi:hypothetical protein